MTGRQAPYRNRKLRFAAGRQASASTPTTLLKVGRAPEEQAAGWGGLNDAWTALSTLIAGLIVWGGLGWLGDKWLNTTPWLFVVGALVGFAGGTYLVYVKAFPKEESKDAA